MKWRRQHWVSRVLVNLGLLLVHLQYWIFVFIGFSGSSLLRGGTDVGE